MGQEIQIQGWNGKNLWENFQKQHPEVTDQKCRRILFNITLVFNILPTLSNQNLKSVLQYILGYNCSYNKDSMATLETRVKILSAIVNSDETDENSERYLSDTEITERLRPRSLPMPEREKLIEVGKFLRKKIEKTIRVIDDFSKRTSEAESYKARMTTNYFDTQKTLERTSGVIETGKPATSLNVPPRKTVTFEATP